MKKTYVALLETYKLAIEFLKFRFLKKLIPKFYAKKNTNIIH